MPALLLERREPVVHGAGQRGVLRARFAEQLQGLFAELPIPQWGRTERGYWEYSVVATNKTLALRALWHFAAGRGVQEKTLGEVKTGYAFASIPSRT
jgi:hypothetical protein